MIVRYELKQSISLFSLNYYDPIVKVILKKDLSFGHLNITLLSCYSFSIPFSNLCILLFSSLPLQSAQIFIKIGFLNNTIESLGQSLSCGLLSIILQLKEFLYSYFSLSDCLIGSIFYFTTGLHGFHVIIGTFLFFLILFFIQFVISLII